MNFRTTSSQTRGELMNQMFNIETIMLNRQQEIVSEIEKLRIESGEIETTLRVMRRYTVKLKQPTQEDPQPKPSSERKEPEEPEPEIIGSDVIPLFTPSNRKERRQFERARKRLDKFVEPKGPQPIIKPREPRKPSEPKPPKPEVQTITVPTNEPMIVDKINGEDVLFEEKEFYGEFSFRDTILDQLDRYFFYISRMKKSDPESFELYSKIGGAILPYTSTWHDWDDEDNMPDPEELKRNTKVPSWFHHQRPGFGCIAWGTDPRTEKYEQDHTVGKLSTYVPKFFYFRKMKDPSPYVQRGFGDIYCATIWWDNGKKGYGVSQEFYVAISADGTTIEVLRVLSTKMKEIYSKKRYDPQLHRPKCEWFDIPDRQWRIPDTYHRWARQWGITAELHLAHIFCTIMTRHEFAQSAMARVAVKKDNMTATFCISPRRMGYFFQDRDVTLTKNGAKERVFHMVKPYSYLSKKGKTVNIKMHFRGKRQFTWAGYSVSITVPGLDHLLFDELNIPVSDEYWIDKGERIVTAKGFGEAVASLPRTIDEFATELEKKEEIE
jgi:hypothetical protein